MQVCDHSEKNKPVQARSGYQFYVDSRERSIHLKSLKGESSNRPARETLTRVLLERVDLLSSNRTVDTKRVIQSETD